ncbi:MAG: hypothetical protein NVV57_10735 [Demequina sp.]|jgi:hypothetical protein|nr:hypothetical protein [Demequina sp.]
MSTTPSDPRENTADADEDRVRRRAEQHGLRLEKSLGGWRTAGPYELVNADTWIVAGNHETVHGYTLQQVEEYLDGLT